MTNEQNMSPLITSDEDKVRTLETLMGGATFCRESVRRIRMFIHTLKPRQGEERWPVQNLIKALDDVSHGIDAEDFAALNEAYDSLCGNDLLRQTGSSSVTRVSQRVVDKFYKLFTKRIESATNSRVEFVLCHENTASGSENDLYELDEEGEIKLRLVLSLKCEDCLAPPYTNVHISIHPGRRGEGVKNQQENLSERVGEMRVGSAHSFTLVVPLNKRIWRCGKGQIKLNVSAVADKGDIHQELKISFRVSCPIKDKNCYGPSEATPRRFVGRVDLLDNMIGAFSVQQGGRGFLLTGLRSSGKTSLLINLRCRLPQNCFYTFIRIERIECRKLAVDQHEEALFDMVMAKAEKELVKELDDRNNYYKDDAPLDVNGDIRLERILAFMKQQNRVWVLCIDEYQNLYDGNRQQANVVAEKIRAYLSVPEPGFHIALSVCKLLEPLGCSSNAIKVLELHRINYFSKNELAELAALVDPFRHHKGIVSQIARRFDDQVVTWLFRMTGGCPYLAQILCSRLLKRLTDKTKKSPNINILDNDDCLAIENECFDRPSQDGYLPPGAFEGLFSLGDPDCEDNNKLLDLYYKLANGNCVLDSPDELRMLKCLIKYGIVHEENEGRFSLTVGFWSKWLLKNRREDCSPKTFWGGN